LKISRCLSLFCLLVVIAAASHSPASEKPRVVQQDDGTHEFTEPVQPPRWNASLETTWLPDSGIDGGKGNVAMEEVKFELGRQFRLNPRLYLSAGLSYCLLNIDAPQSALLPESLHTLSLSLGGSYEVTDDLTLGLTLAPGLSSDFKEIDMDDVRLRATLYARYRVSSRLTLIGGAKYKGSDDDSPVVPIVRVQYRPSEQWTFNLGIPRSTVVFKPNNGTEYYLGVQLSSGDTYELHDKSLGADSISYTDYKALAGVEFPLTRVVGLCLSGGYAFGRELDFSDADRADMDLDNTPFGRLELKLAW